MRTFFSFFFFFSAFLSSSIWARAAKLPCEAKARRGAAGAAADVDEPDRASAEGSGFTDDFLVDTVSQPVIGKKRGGGGETRAESMQATSGGAGWVVEGIVDVPSSAGAPAASLSDEALERMPCCRTSWEPPESPARLEEEGRVALPLGAVWPLHNTRRRERTGSVWRTGWEDG